MSCISSLIKNDYYTSKWVACNPLPVQYELQSDLFPVNNVDMIESIINVGNNNGFAQITSGTSDETYQAKEYIKISGSSNYDGVWQIKEVDSYGLITIDAPYIVNDSGEFQKYYNNYHILVKCFVGLPLGHALESIRPTELKQTLKLIPDTSNKVYADVSSAIRSDFQTILNKYCALLQDANDVNVNDTNLWTSFYIAYAESYDIVVDNEIITYTSDYTTDKGSGVETELFTNPSFVSGLSGYTQFAETYGLAWTAGSGYINFTYGGSLLLDSYYVGQSINFEAGKTYKINITYSGLYSGIDGYYIRLQGAGTYLQYGTLVSKGGIISLEYTPTTSFTDYLVFKVSLYASGHNINLESFSVMATTASINVYYATNSTQQFKYAQGNNMGEYVLNDNGLVAPTKFMTLFPTSSLWIGNEFDLSIIVPTGLLGTYDDLSYGVYEYDSNGVLLRIDYVYVFHYDEGLYRIRLDNYNFGENTKYFTVAMYLHNTNENTFTRISEERKVVIEDAACKSPTYLTWFNYLGAWEYFKFSAYKDYEYANGENKVIRRNIFNIWDTDFIQGDTQDDIISKADNFNFTLVRSQRLTLEQRDTIVNWLKRSIKAMLIESGEYDCITENNKRTIIIDTDSFTIQERDKSYFIDFKFRDTNTILTQIQ